MTLRILLADDHALFREGLRMLLSARGFEIVSEVGTGVAAVEAAQELVPDLIVMDLDMPEMGGLEATRLIKTALPEVPIVILTASERDGDLFEAIKAGALGYVLKTMSSEALVQQVEAAARGEADLDPRMAARVLGEFSRVSQWSNQPTLTHAVSQAPADSKGPDEEGTEALTGRERDVLQRLIGGASNKQIADDIVVSENTVKYHLKNILRKLHVNNRAQVVAWAMRQDWYRRSTS